MGGGVTEDPMTDEAPNLSELMVRFQRFEEQAWRVSEPAAAMIRAVLGEQIALLGGDVPASVDPHAHPLYRAAQLRLREDAALAEAETDTRQPLPTSEVRIDRVPDLQVTPSRAPVYDDDNPRYEDLSLYELEPAEPLGVQLGTGEETDGGSVAFRLEDMPEPAEVDPDQPRLVLHAGTEEEEQLSLDSEGEITLGRGKSCTIRLPRCPSIQGSLPRLARR